jgi:hypothetical protein
MGLLQQFFFYPGQSVKTRNQMALLKDEMVRLIQAGARSGKLEITFNQHVKW